MWGRTRTLAHEDGRLEADALLAAERAGGPLLAVLAPVLLRALLCVVTRIGEFGGHRVVVGVIRLNMCTPSPIRVFSFF